MFENDLAQACAFVLDAKRFQARARPVKVFDQLFFRWWIQGLYTLGCFHAQQAPGNNPGRHETPKQKQSLRRLRERVLEGVDDVLFNQREMMDNFGNAPFVVGWPATEAFVIYFGDKTEELAVNRVKSGKCSVQGSRLQSVLVFDNRQYCLESRLR